MTPIASPVSTGDAVRILLGLDPYTLQKTDRVEEIGKLVSDFSWIKGSGFVGSKIDTNFGNKVENAVDIGFTANAINNGYNDQKNGKGY